MGSIRRWLRHPGVAAPFGQSTYKAASRVNTAVATGARAGAGKTTPTPQPPAAVKSIDAYEEGWWESRAGVYWRHTFAKGEGCGAVYR